MLDKFDELEFVHQLSLPRSKRIPSGINFECPFCLEGKSKGRKRRAFLLLTNPKEGNVFFCHNCHKSISFKNFLKEYNVNLYNDYLAKEKSLYIEKLKKGQINAKQKKVEWKLKNPGLEFFTLNRNYFQSVGENKQALEYCRERKIPEKCISGLLYFPETEISEYVEASVRKEYEAIRGMVVFPFYSPQGIYGYQGRTIKGKRFHTNSQPGYKIYNIFNIDPNKRVYIFESIIDSLYVPNSIALLGSSLRDIPLFHKMIDPIFVLDNDVSNDVITQMEKLVNQGLQVVVWPTSLKENDVNEMILNDRTEEDVQDIIDSNFYSGLHAKIKIGNMKWKKKRK